MLFRSVCEHPVESYLSTGCFYWRGEETAVRAHCHLTTRINDNVSDTPLTRVMMKRQGFYTTLLLNN